MFSKRENDLIMVYNVHTAGAVKDDRTRKQTVWDR